MNIITSNIFADPRLIEFGWILYRHESPGRFENTSIYSREERVLRCNLINGRAAACNRQVWRTSPCVQTSYLTIRGRPMARSSKVTQQMNLCTVRHTTTMLASAMCVAGRRARRPPSRFSLRGRFGSSYSDLGKKGDICGLPDASWTIQGRV